jgi:hypothetical protein
MLDLCKGLQKEVPLFAAIVRSVKCREYLPVSPYRGLMLIDAVCGPSCPLWVGVGEQTGSADRGIANILFLTFGVLSPFSARGWDSFATPLRLALTMALRLEATLWLCKAMTFLLCFYNVTLQKVTLSDVKRLESILYLYFRPLYRMLQNAPQYSVGTARQQSR